jgi:hypothetical protein
MSDEIHLRLLRSKINCSAIVPLDPKFKAMPWAEYRPFQLRLPVGFKASALAFFKLFFTDAMFDILVQNTNLNATDKEARTSQGWTTQSRWWRLINTHKLSIWIALHISTRLNETSNIESYWVTDKFCIHGPMQYMSWFRVEQIKRYFMCQSQQTGKLPLAYEVIPTIRASPYPVYGVLCAVVKC